MPSSEVIPAVEAARQKGCTRAAIYNAMNRGDLNEVRYGRTRLVVVDEKFDRYAVQETGGRRHAPANEARK